MSWEKEIEAAIKEIRAMPDDEFVAICRSFGYDPLPGMSILSEPVESIGLRSEGLSLDFFIRVPEEFSSEPIDPLTIPSLFHAFDEDLRKFGVQVDDGDDCGLSMAA